MSLSPVNENVVVLIRIIHDCLVQVEGRVEERREKGRWKKGREAQDKAQLLTWVWKGNKLAQSFLSWLCMDR